MGVNRHALRASDGRLDQLSFEWRKHRHSGLLCRLASDKLREIAQYSEFHEWRNLPLSKIAGEHMLKATAGYSRTPERDVALLLTLYGTAMATTELAKLTVSDYLEADGTVKVNSAVRHDVSHNGELRPLYWSNRRVVNAVNKYLAWRLEHKHAVTVKNGTYLGLDPDSALFMTDDGKPYALTAKKLPSGVLSYSCNTLGPLFRSCTPMRASKAAMRRPHVGHGQ